MDTLENYRCSIQNLLETYAAQLPAKGGVESQLLMDTQRDHYQWMRVGWNDRQRVYHVVMHLDIKDGKVWIQQNTTDTDLTQALLAAGVLREDIVLGLQPLYKRELSGAAIA
jgi:XisI protein